MQPTVDPAVSSPDLPGVPILGTFGRRAFITGLAGATAGALVGSSVIPSVASAIEPGACFFQPVTPTRLCDTRTPSTGVGYASVGPNTIRVKVAGTPGVAGDATAAVLTVTGINKISGDNWISVFPAGGAWPGTSSLNSSFSGQVVPNLVTVKLGTGAAAGHVDIRSFGETDVIVDLAGVYRPTSVAVKAGRFVAIEPVRVKDTRPGRVAPGGVIAIDLNGVVPADAVAVVANLTAVDADGAGFFTTYPFGVARPNSSNLNVVAREVRAVGIMTKLGTAGGSIGFNVYSQSGAQIIVDVAGYVTGSNAAASTDGLFVPIDPFRSLDTRNDAPPQRLRPGWTRSFTLPSPISTRAQAIAMNLTATQTFGAGYFTMNAARTVRREVSTLNVTGSNQTIANQAISAVSPAGVACYTQSGAHVICDVTGWFVGTPAPITTSTPENPISGGPLPWTLTVPRIGLSHKVLTGEPYPVVDSGQSWHWTGTGLVGEGGHVSVFAHRTEHGGPYRQMHTLRGGDPLYIDTADGRRYTYRFVNDVVTGKVTADILAATRVVAGETFSMIACTKPNRLPTDLDYRLIANFQLVGWVDVG